MRLAELVEGLPVEGTAHLDLEVGGIAYDSRQVEPGDLFVAWAGRHADGRSFARQAAERGAVAVLAAGPPPPDNPLPWLRAEAPRALLGPLASRLYGHPERELTLVGVTGTNGKTTTATLLAAMLEAAGQPAGFFGTVGYRFAGRAFAGERTTPEGSDFFRLLREMRDQGAAAVAMEVSSHALAQDRVAGAEFDAAVFTNLTRDHFDFHRDFEDYFAAKRRLFTMLKPGGRGAANADDSYGRRLLAEFPAALGYGLEQGEVRPLAVELDARGIRGLLVTPRGDFPFASSLLGRLNLWNIVAAATGAEALGLPHPAVAAAIAAQPPLPGRLEPVDRGQPFPVLIDYAHTDAALEAALRSVRELARRKVAVVFGCGGDKDPGKRPLMGRVAGELAELPIVTSDNPRSEDPLQIIGAVEQGLKLSGNTEYRVVPDRREAIRRAVAVAANAPGEWVVLVAGKGHEQEQILADRSIPFSDRAELEEALEEKLGPAARG
jgi:UDP-N-acetylmuramoyl-L-alanyl-D-glutamate--2,6-diaminopimelate ligase